MKEFLTQPNRCSTCGEERRRDGKRKEDRGGVEREEEGGKERGGQGRDREGRRWEGRRGKDRGEIERGGDGREGEGRTGEGRLRRRPRRITEDGEIWRSSVLQCLDISTQHPDRTMAKGQKEEGGDMRSWEINRKGGKRNGRDGMGRKYRGTGHKPY